MTDRTNVTVKPREIEADAWEAAAEACGMTRHAWCLAILNAAAGISPLPDQMQRVLGKARKTVRDGEW